MCCNPLNVLSGKIVLITVLLILWEFDCSIDHKFENDVLGRSHELLINLVVLEKIREIDFQHIFDSLFVQLNLERTYGKNIIGSD